MALGFALVYGISRVPNFAHGAIYVVAGFITWTFLKAVGLSLFSQRTHRHSHQRASLEP